jgi:hypothetical protein
MEENEIVVYESYMVIRVDIKDNQEHEEKIIRW